MKASWPDIIVTDCKKKTCLLIDITVPSDRNLSIKEYKKVSKYKDLEIEIQKMWNLKAINTSCSWGIRYDKEEN